MKQKRKRMYKESQKIFLKTEVLSMRRERLKVWLYKLIIKYKQIILQIGKFKVLQYQCLVSQYQHHYFCFQPTPSFIIKFMLLHITILLLHISLIQAFNFRGVYVNITDTRVRATTSYSLYLDRTTDTNSMATQWNQQIVSTLANVTITFPQEYVSSANYTCLSLIVDDFIIRNYSCVKIGTQIIIRNFLTTDQYIKTVQITVGNVKNPKVGGTTGNFLSTLGNDTGIPYFFSSVTLTANSFDSCSVSFPNSYGNSSSNLVVQTTSMNSIQNSDYLVITFPYYWTRDAGTQQIAFQANKLCSLASGQISSIQCSGSFGSNGYPRITINQLISGIATATKIFGVLSPPTNQPIDLVKIQSFDYLNRPIDMCTTYPSGLIERTITNINVTPLQTPYPSTSIGLTLVFQLPQTLVSTDTIYLSLSSSYSPSFSFVNLTGTYPVTIFEASGALVNFTFNRTQSISQVITITIYSITTPSSIAPVLPFQIGIEQYGYLKMKGNFGFNTRVGVINAIELSVDDPRAGLNSVYRLNFTVSGALSRNGAVRVYFPDVLVIPSNVKVYCLGVQLTSTKLPDTNCLQLTNFQILPTNPIRLTFANITNPSTTTPLSLSISIITYLTTSLMDEMGEGSTNVILTLNARPTLLCQMTSSSIVTAEPDVNFTFVVNNTLPLVFNSYVRVFYQAIDGCQNFGKLVCWVNGRVEVCWDAGAGSIGVSLNNTQVASRLGFNIVIGDCFTNPPNTKPVALFEAKTYTPQGYLLQYMTMPVYLNTITQARQLSYFVLLSRTSTVNSARSTYTFAVSQQQSLVNTGNNVAILTFPSYISIAQSSCVNCQISGSTIQLSISSSSFTITISNVLNRVSAEPTSDFQVRVMMDSQYLYSQSLQLHNAIANNQPSILNVVSSTYSSGLYGDTCSLVIKVSGILSAINNFVFTFPKEYDIRNIACAMLGGNISSCITSNSSLILSISTISTPNLTITLSNFILPNLNQSLPILISSFSASGYIISSSSIPAWQPICTLPCRTCPLNNPNQCLSCFNNIQISFLNLHDPANSRCVDQCDQTQILIQMTCISCSNSCASCENITTNCTSCRTGFYLYDHQCLANCPDLYYRVIQGRYCEVCQTPCQTCVTQTQCLSCRIGYYFFNGICRISCPNAVTVPDSINNVCLPCSPICLSCADTVDHCTSCNIGFAMQAGVCVSQCSNNMYILNSQCVQNCLYPCITCSIYATYCLTCPATLYLYSNKCVSQCAFAYYASPARQCLPCSSLAINCINCQSPTICLTCDPGFVFFEDQCINYIPSGYANISGIAQPCSNQCVTCLNLVNNCTSCRYDFYYNGLCIPTCPITHYSHNHQCIRCVSPCNTCLNSTACLSCLGSTNKFWLSTSLSCETLCPQFYYANSSISQCLACQPPCVSCTSLTSCISCIQGTYFYNSRCITTCPPGYFPNDTLKQCTICQSPCLTCSTLSPTVCLTCISTYYYLYPNACVTSCPPEYIVNYEYRVCVNCTLPCLVCSQTQCFKCQNTHILYLQKCAFACPSTHYIDILSDLTKECKVCPRQCQTCLNANFCTLCSIGYFWQSGSSSGICVQTCPTTRPILMPTGCQPCQDENCTQCYPNNECYQCTNVTILFNGFCLLECPIGYVYNSSIETCELAPPPIINQTVIIEQPNLSVTITMPIHMICTIVGAGLTLFIVITVCCSDLMLWPLLTAVWAIVEVAAITIVIYSYHLYFVYLFTDKKIYGFILTAAAAWFLLVNTSVFFHSICRVLLPDPRYRRWRKSAKCSQIFLLSLVQTSTLLNFKFQHLLWSGFKGSPKLQSTSKLNYLSVSSALGLVNSIAIVIILIFLINDVSSLFFVWLDAIVVIVIAAILSGLALKRSDKFFQEKLEDVILHRKHISSDQFPSNPMKGTHRQEEFCPTPQQKSFGQPSYFESSSESSSRYQLRSSSRVFVSSRSHSSQPESYQNDQIQIAELQKKEISLQCSILSPNKSSSRSINSSASGSKKYYIECDYQSGSKIGVMGSLEESKQWDGVVHQPVYFKEQYNLNNAVILDQDGNLVEGWDVESNEAVIEQSVDYNSKQTSFHNQEQQHNQRILDDLQQVQTAEAIKNNFKKIDNYIQRQDNESLINMESENNESIDPITHRNNVQQNEEKMKECNNDLKKEKVQKQQKSVIQNYRDLLKQRLADPAQISNVQRQQNFSRLTNKSKNNQIKTVQNKNKLILSEAEILIPDQTVISVEQTIKKQDNFEKDLKQEEQEKQQNQQEHQITENDKDQPEQASQNDRFDNSVISGHQGSISDSQGDEYEGSQISNHNGSFESDENNEEEQSSSENVSDEGQRKYTSVSIENEKNINRSQQCENEIERWQFLLYTNDKQNKSEQKKKQQNEKELKRDQDEDDNIENDENKDDEQNEYDENGIQLEQIKQFSQQHSQEIVNNSSKLVSQKQKGEKKKEGNLKDSKVSGKSKKQTKQGNNKKGSDRKQIEKRNKQIGKKVEDEQQINQIDDQEQGQYLHAKQTKRQSKHDDHNQFSIKTKVKKKDEPKHKVVVVESKKFKKLKRQASELQKQVDKGQRLKTQMEEQPNSRVKSREPRERKSMEKKKSRDEQLKGIYMRSKRPQV